MVSATENGSAAADTPICFVKELPARLHERAADYAVQVHRLNTPMLSATVAMEPGQLAVITGKYWGPNPRVLTVSFMESPAADFRARVLEHMNAWDCSISFVQVPQGQTGDVRISTTGMGYWSYLGTDIMLVPKSNPTMNLQGFSMFTRESEYKRVVRHETGHTLGFPHEHLRKEIVANIDPARAYKYFADNDNWSKAVVDNNVLTPIDNATLLGGPVDADSIMCYHLPGEIMKDGKAVPGGLNINAADRGFATSIYPPRTAADVHPCWPKVPVKRMSEVDDWGEENDVHLNGMCTA